MNISQVYAVYFSATGNTRKVTTTLANALAVSFDVPLEVRDFTLPAAREEAYEFAAGRPCRIRYANLRGQASK